MKSSCSSSVSWHFGGSLCNKNTANETGKWTECVCGGLNRFLACNKIKFKK